MQTLWPNVVFLSNFHEFPMDFLFLLNFFALQERQDAMYKMFGAEYEAPESKLYAELEGEQVGIDLMTTKNAEKLSCGCPLDWAVDGPLMDGS